MSKHEYKGKNFIQAFADILINLFNQISKFQNPEIGKSITAVGANSLYQMLHEMNREVGGTERVLNNNVPLDNSVPMHLDMKAMQDLMNEIKNRPGGPEMTDTRFLSQDLKQALVEETPGRRLMAALDKVERIC